MEKCVSRLNEEVDMILSYGVENKSIEHLRHPTKGNIFCMFYVSFLTFCRPEKLPRVAIEVYPKIYTHFRNSCHFSTPF